MATANPTRHGNGFKDRTGQRVGRVTAIRYSHTVGKNAFWECLCDCGKLFCVRSTQLARTRSCGCFKKHGHTSKTWSSREWRAWHDMRHRCKEMRDGPRQNYFDRGICVCPQWQDSFLQFLADVGPAPSPKHTIERINNDGHYEPGNVRWATRAEQSRNRRVNIMLTFQGETLCGTDWARRLGVPPVTFLSWVRRLGAQEAFRRCANR